MKITRVCCQGCGADLEVDESVRYVTCNYCQARLEVVHDPSVTHTRLMEQLEQTTGRLADNLKVIELQNDLARLDREWEQREESLMVTGRNGHRSVPNAAGAIVGGVVAGVFGLIWTATAANMGAPSPFPLFGIAFIAFGVISAIHAGTKAGRYRDAQSAHETARNELIRRIEQARSQERQ